MPTLAVLDIFGFIVLAILLVIIAAIQAGAAVGIMWLMHKHLRDKLPATNYGSFDFDNFQRLPFQDLLLRLGIIFLGATLIIHLGDFVLIGTLIRKYPTLVRFTLFLLETGAILAGFHFIFRLDKLRLAVLTGGSALFYLFWLWYLTAGRNYLA